MGRRRVSGVQPRFFVIVGMLVLTIVAAFTFLKPEPGPVASYDPSICPLFPVDKHTELPGCELTNPNARNTDTLATLPTDWLSAYKRQHGVETRVTDISQFTGANWASSMGQPLRMKVFVPATGLALQARPDLGRRTRGFTFVPATLIKFDQTQTLEELASAATQMFSSEEGGVPMTLGFRDTEMPTVPADGAAFEVTAVPYWRSDLLNSEAFDGTRQAAPVLLVGEAQPISTVELAAPTTHRAPVDIVYQEGDQEVVIHDIEWSTVSQQMRVCASVTNTGVLTTTTWGGVTNMLATLPGQAPETGMPDSTAGFAGGGSLLRGATLRGYVTFGTAVDPNKPLLLEMPAVTATDASTGDAIRVTVPIDRITAVGDTSELDASPCGGGERIAR